MEIYFYCSYERSPVGFVMTKLSGETLLPAEYVPSQVEDFFSYDLFQILWYDMTAQEERSFWKPQTSGAFFGLRNLQGSMADGRRMTVNMVITAEEEETTALRRIALSALGELPLFQRRLTGLFSVSGAGYGLDTAAFSAWLREVSEMAYVTRLAPPRSKAASLLMWMQRADAPRTENELLRLAVCTSDKKDVRRVMGDGLVWKLKHPCVMVPSEFEEIFLSETPIWRLSDEL